MITGVTMQRRPWIGALTFLYGLPGLVAPFVIIASYFPGSTPLDLRAAILFVVGFIARGLCGVIGGVDLWRGRRMGYTTALFMWGWLVFAGLLTLMQVSGGTVPTHLLQKTIARSLGNIVVGSAMAIVLLRDLRNVRRMHRVIG